jgi:hypothetical protein
MIEEEEEGAEYDDEEEVEDYGGEEFNCKNLVNGPCNEHENMTENLMMASIKLTENTLKMKQKITKTNNVDDIW